LYVVYGKYELRSFSASKLEERFLIEGIGLQRVYEVPTLVDNVSRWKKEQPCSTSETDSSQNDPRGEVGGDHRSWSQHFTLTSLGESVQKEPVLSELTRQKMCRPPKIHLQVFPMCVALLNDGLVLTMWNFSHA
jgi:hypothetical protein